MALSAHQFDAGTFGSLRTPTLFLLSDRSPPFMVASVKAGLSAVPDAKLEMLAGQQHGALVQAPDMIAAIIRKNFLSS